MVMQRWTIINTPAHVSLGFIGSELEFYIFKQGTSLLDKEKPCYFNKRYVGLGGLRSAAQ